MLNKNDFVNSSVFLGIDFGIKCIGIASGQKITMTASPLLTLTAKNGVPNWADLDKIIKEWCPAALIVGVPIGLDGKKNWVTKAALKFIKSLRERYSLPVIEANEQLTTKAAHTELFACGGYKALKKEKIDSMAAKLILEGWLRSDFNEK